MPAGRVAAADIGCGGNDARNVALGGEHGSAERVAECESRRDRGGECAARAVHAALTYGTIRVKLLESAVDEEHVDGERKRRVPALHHDRACTERGNALRGSLHVVDGVNLETRQQ